MIEICFDASTEANLRFLYAQGFIDSDTVLCCPDDYSLGKFNNFSIDERYKQLCEYGLVGYDKRNKDWFYQKYSLFLNGLNKIKQGDKVRIWISNVPFEMIGFFVVCYFLRNKLNNVFLCDASEILNEESKHSALLEYPDDFIKVINKMENVEILKNVEIGKKIFFTDKSIRIVKNGEVIMMDEQDLDHLIYDEINNQKFKSIGEVTEAVFEKSSINYLYLYKRVEEILEG